MTINKKMIRNIILGILALTILGGVYFWAVGWQPHQDEEEIVENNSIPLFDADAKEITELLIKNEQARFSLKSTINNDEVVWTVPEYPNITFSQTKIKNLIANLSSISATQKIDAAEKSPAEFGIDTQKNSVTIRLKNGSECILLLGNRPTADSDYYLMKKGDHNIYTISQYKASELLRTPNSLRDTTLATMNIQGIEALSIEHGGKKLIDISENDKADPTGVYQMSTLRMTYPYDEVISVDRFQNIAAVFTGIEVIQFISDNPTDAAKYGLENGYKITLRESGKVHRLSLGDTDTDGNVYAMYGDNKFIFTMKADIKNAIKDIKPFDYIDKLAHIYSIDKVSSIVIEYGSSSHELSIKRVSDDAEKTEYLIDDKTVGEDSFKKTYQSIIGLAITEPVGDKAKGKQFCKITFNLLDTAPQTATYYEYDERNLLVTRPNGKQYLMLKKYVEEMLKKVAE